LGYKSGSIFGCKKQNTSDWSEPFLFTTLVTQNDTNTNGIPDALENTDVDLDDDGIFDIQQVDEIKSLNTFDDSGQIGASIKDSATVTSIVKVDSIDPEDISDVARPEEMPLGLFSFMLTVENAGDVTDITIYFSEAAPAYAIWYVYDSTSGWSDYSQYATFSSDRESVNVQLKDGGYGDADGIANGIIVDPCGFGIGSWIQGAISDSTTGQEITTATINFENEAFSLNSLLDGNYLSMILPGTYNFTVSAPGYITQSFSNIEIAEASIVTENITLSKDIKSIPVQTGWNLISLPVTPLATKIENVLSSISSKYSSIWAYQNNSWRGYNANNPGSKVVRLLFAGLAGL